MNGLNKKRSGFTLIEMTVVLFIISLLILIIIPNIANSRKHAQGIHSRAMTSVVQTQIDSYLDDHDDSNNTKVGLSDLRSQDYLSNAQYQKAKSEGIHVDNNRAILGGH